MKASYEQANQRISTAVNLSRDQSSKIKLLAVSKFHSIEKITELYQLGQRYFGENYAQELVEKVNSLSSLSITWSFIGQLQSNKLKKIVFHADEIQSVARLKDAIQIERYVCEKQCNKYPIFLCINASNEPQKRGARMEEAADIANEIESKCPHLVLKGIMAIPPRLDTLEKSSDSQVPDLYLELRNLANTIGQGQLSLGMSQDLEAAIAAGSDIVRLGTALFGERPKNKPI